jgi:tRNA threonylcarbamoyladenosine biosynthesis protein TsaE
MPGEYGATEALGQALGWSLEPRLREPPAWIVFLAGPLGAGKTTFARGVLAALGHRGHVTSPTYTIVEPYELAGHQVLHVDLYRLGDPHELEFLGLREVLAGPALILVEWPERGLEGLVRPDIVVRLEHAGAGRVVELRGVSARGAAVEADLRAST